MTINAPVPSAVDPDSILDLVDDCREVSGVLAPYVVDLAALEAARVPAPRTTIDLTTGLTSAAAVLDGYGEYGS